MHNNESSQQHKNFNNVIKINESQIKDHLAELIIANKNCKLGL